jgi:hypothetical protein
MFAPSKWRDIFFALLLSLAAAFLAAVAYAFYPLISAVVAGLRGSRAGAGSGGIGAVAGGGVSSLLTMIVVEPVFFLIIFALLRRRRALC